MTLHRSSAENMMLVDEVAAVVEEVAGVVFLRPGLADRLRSTLTRPGGAGRDRRAGVRVDQPADGGPWRVEIHVVVDRRARAVDVARAVRTRVEDHAAARAPRRPPPHVTVTVTGRV
ncbi:hypothetical protein [Streptomyces sp. VRA16 Mangrove soil]|uniref:hypothetical protein n=1 Tax=Streptomyces sp. VRA16 Mangrove soil TaxID=2817434 RepID=UPI001A9EC8C6|nr:hypothetical protein [Streptomyces sp. VRA16 Mangrove soil]MBO1337957.1 hypothetical protein [Streptomyces sp. VRA16 Mangrove soil]